jgi:metal-dependent hydrolase (beta-lactamase superfamily II)
VGLTTPQSKKLIVTKVEQRKKLDGFNDDGGLVTGKKWKDLVRQAKAHSGLQCQWKKKKKVTKSRIMRLAGNVARMG